VTGEAASDQASLLSGVQDIVSGLLPTSLAIADDLASCAIERTPELHGLGLEALVTANCRAHMTALLDYLARGVPVDKVTLSQEIVENARTMVRSGLPLDSMLRGHRVAASRFIALWTDAVAEQQRGDSAAAIGIIKHGSAYSLEWVDAICELMTTLYGHEMERLRAPNGMRLARVLQPSDSVVYV
jgi:hypothetical protein